MKRKSVSSLIYNSFTRCYPLTRLMAVQYRYNSLVDGTGPPMYKYVIPYTTYHLNTSHIYHFFCYIYILHIDIYIYHSFFLWRGGTRLYNSCISSLLFHCFVLSLTFPRFLSNQPPGLPFVFISPLK